MPYKHIVVDGKNYEYFLGRCNLKVKGLGVFSRKGQNIETIDEITRIIRETCIKDRLAAQRIKKAG